MKSSTACVEPERRELVDGLPVDVERDLARGEDPQLGHRVEQADRQRGRRVEHVLAVVEDERRVRAARSRSSSAASPPVTLRAAMTVSSTSSAVVAASRRASQTLPGSVRPVAIASAVLPMPPGPTTSTSRCASQHPRERGDVVVAADELGLQRREVPRRRGAERGVVLEDLALELLQARARVEPEVLGEPRADALIGGERVGLAAGAVERGDQQRPQALLVGRARDGGLEVGDDRLAEPQPRRELGLEQLGPGLLELRAVRRGPVAGRGQQLAAEAAERGRAELAGAVLVAGVEAARRQPRRR